MLDIIFLMESASTSSAPKLWIHIGCITIHHIIFKLVSVPPQYTQSSDLIFPVGKSMLHCPKVEFSLSQNCFKSFLSIMRMLNVCLRLLTNVCLIFNLNPIDTVWGQRRSRGRKGVISLCPPLPSFPSFLSSEFVMMAYVKVLSEICCLASHEHAVPVGWNSLKIDISGF